MCIPSHNPTCHNNALNIHCHKFILRHLLICVRAYSVPLFLNGQTHTLQRMHTFANTYLLAPHVVFLITFVAL